LESQQELGNDSQHLKLVSLENHWDDEKLSLRKILLFLRGSLKMR